MNEVNISPGLRVNVSKGRIGLREDWLEVKPEAGNSICGVRLQHRNREYIHRRVADLNKIMQESTSGKFSGMVATVEEL